MYFLVGVNLVFIAPPPICVVVVRQATVLCMVRIHYTTEVHPGPFRSSSALVFSLPFKFLLIYFFNMYAIKILSKIKTI